MALKRIIALTLTTLIEIYKTHFQVICGIERNSYSCFLYVQEICPAVQIHDDLTFFFWKEKKKNYVAFLSKKQCLAIMEMLCDILFDLS